MEDYPRYRRHLLVKRLGTRLLQAALGLKVRLRPRAAPAAATGTVVLLDRCLGLGDGLMISPALRLLDPLGPVTVVTALPPLLDWAGDWRRCPDWPTMTEEVRRLVGEGRRLLVPKLGVRGFLTLLAWRGGLPAGVIWQRPDAWLDTVSGRSGAISGRHYTDAALACARALLRHNLAGALQAAAVAPLVRQRLHAHLDHLPGRHHSRGQEARQEARGSRRGDGQLAAAHDGALAPLVAGVHGNSCRAQHNREHASVEPLHAALCHLLLQRPPHSAVHPPVQLCLGLDHIYGVDHQRLLLGVASQRGQEAPLQGATASFDAPPHRQTCRQLSQVQAVAFPGSP